MKLFKPYISEKTITLAKDGRFTFIVDKEITKDEFKQLLKKYYHVDVVKAKVINKKNRLKKGSKGIGTKRGYKKIISTLADKQVVPGFEIAKESKKEKSEK